VNKGERIMATKKKTQAAEEKTAQPSEVVTKLVVASVNAKGQMCHAGMTIAPNVDGWPAHRVAKHVKEKAAVVVEADGQ
jgi:hypothetical protein